MAGQRVFYDLHSQQPFPFEATAAIPAAEVLEIGRFRFYRNAFLQAQHVLLSALSARPDWLVIDEVGKLEVLHGQGLEPAVGQLIGAYRNGPGTGRLLLVIREELLQAAVEKYGLEDAGLLTAAGLAAR